MRGDREGYRKNIFVHQRKVTPQSLLENLETAKFYDIEVSVPKKAETYLVILYGKQWRTPLEILREQRRSKTTKGEAK